MASYQVNLSDEIGFDDRRTWRNMEKTWDDYTLTWDDYGELIEKKHPFFFSAFLLWEDELLPTASKMIS